MTKEDGAWYAPYASRHRHVQLPGLASHSREVDQGLGDFAQGDNSLGAASGDGLFGHAEDDAGLLVLGDRVGSGLAHAQQARRAATRIAPRGGPTQWPWYARVCDSTCCTSAVARIVEVQALYLDAGAPRARFVG